MEIKKELKDTLALIKDFLGVDETFDINIREFKVAHKNMAMLGVNGLTDGLMITEMFQTLFEAEREEISVNTLEKILATKIPNIQTRVLEANELRDAINEVLAGQVALFIDGERSTIIIDTRHYPARGPKEPDIERVSRGSRDGFVETLLFNTALIRRRLKDPNLRFKILNVGRRSQTSVAIGYIKDITNPKLVEMVKERIEKIKIDGIPTAEKAVEEFITSEGYSIFPDTRFTERPDVAAIHLLEGHVIVIVDTSPSVIIAPATFFHHTQHVEEYRQIPLIGAYLRAIRFIGIFLSLIISPLWLALVLQKGLLPDWLAFIGPQKIGHTPIILQFIIAEIGVDLIRMAGIHTPTPLATGLGIVSAILIGQIATVVGLFSPEVILYTALAALGTFATPSYEFALSIRFLRLLLIIAVGLFKLPGLIGGLLIIFFYLVTRKSFGIPYMWPLIPFNPRALFAVMVRRRIEDRKVRPEILRPLDPDRQPTKK